MPELDHILIPVEDVWHHRRCHILQVGPSVTPPWTPYTDHNPVSLVLKVGKQWQPPPLRPHCLPQPDVGRMRGNTDEARNLRRQWMTQVERRLSQETSHPQWDKLCVLCRNTAVEVCGVLHHHKGTPCLTNRGPEIQTLDQCIHRAMVTDRTARQTGDPQMMMMCRPRRPPRQSDQLRQWETDWLSLKAAETNRLLDTPASSQVFQLVKDLLNAVGKSPRNGGRRVVASQAEVEDWKLHFQAIQAGLGTVDPRIWTDIPTRAVPPPTWEEFQRALRDMQASSSPDGLEADSWPPEWRVGIAILLWKRKGSRQDKNTWRGISLLSGGAKLIARICAARLQRWCLPWLNPLQFGFKAG